MATPPSISLNEAEIAALIRDRREFHAQPELRYNERRTATQVARRLSGLGYRVAEGIGKTGVVGLLEGAKPASAADSTSRTLLYRADMDALPIQEENDAEYRSRNDGVMHACG